MRGLLVGLAVLFSAHTAQADAWLVAKAERYVGMTAKQIGLKRRTLWCATFINYLLGGGTGSDAARSFLKYGRPAKHGCIGCVAVSSRGRRGGHVSVVKGYDVRGNPITINGNGRGRRVSVHAIPAKRVIAYRYVTNRQTFSLLH